MNLQKAQLKAAIVENIGVSIEDDLEAARIKVHRFQGAVDALGKAKQVLTDLTAKARDDVLNGVVKFDPENPVEVAKFIIARIQESVAKLHEMSEHARLMGLQAEGEVNGLDRIVKKIQAIRDEERNKIDAFMKAVDSGKVVIEDGSPRFVGDGPTPPGTIGLPIRMIREQEAAVEATASSSVEPGTSEAGDDGAPKKTQTKRRKKVKAEANDRNA
jgi:hypothetical protein